MSKYFNTAETFDKIVKALNTTSEELFATNHLKEKEEILAEIKSKADLISEDPEKLDILYNVAVALLKE